jgi:hypothetical protein
MLPGARGHSPPAGGRAEKNAAPMITGFRGTPRHFFTNFPAGKIFEPAYTIRR